MNPSDHMLDALWYTRTLGARIILGISALLWAASLLYPEPTFDKPVYRHMAELMPEYGWALLFLAYSFALMLPYRGSAQGWTVAITLHLFGVVLWLSVLFCLLGARGLSAAAVTHNAALAVASLWVLWCTPRCPPRSRH